MAKSEERMVKFIVSLFFVNLIPQGRNVIRSQRDDMSLVTNDEGINLIQIHVLKGRNIGRNW